MIESKTMPAARAQPATVRRYRMAVRRPRVFQIVASPAALVPGPVMRKTRAAPGLMPLRISAAATGTEAEAHTYMGMPISIMTSMAGRP